MNIYCRNCENACSEHAPRCPKCGQRLKSRAYLLGASIRRGRIDFWPGLMFACVVGGCLGFINAEHQEIKARKRIDEIQKALAREEEQRVAAQLAQRRTLEDIASWRLEGGFKTPEISRQVQARAANAAKRFTRLLPEDINLAFAVFGDLGFSYDELVELAILVHLDLLGDCGMGEPLAVLKRRVRIVQRRNREQVYGSMGLEVPTP